MPIPPNITAATAIAITEGITTQQVDDAGVAHIVYYKYTNNTLSDQVISLGYWGILGGGGYRPLVHVYKNVDFLPANFIHTGLVNGSWSLPIPAGWTYWFRVNFAGNPIPANLNLKFLIGPSGTGLAGNVFIRIASIQQWMIDAGLTGLQGGFIDAISSAIVGFKPQFIAGEAGDILPTSGRMLFVDEYGSLAGFPPGASEYVYLFDKNLSTIITSFPLDFIAFVGSGLIRTHLPTEKFYIATNEFNNFNYRTVDVNGILGPLKPVTDFGTGTNALAVNNAETVMYISHSPSSAALIKRWDMIGNVFLTDLTASLADHRITDLLVMPDDTIIACYFKTTTPRDCFIRRYNSAGILLNTFIFVYSTTLTSTDPRLGYSADTNTFWLLNHLSSGYGDIRKIRISDGVALVTSLTPDSLQGAIEQANPPLPHTSDSCPVIELRLDTITPIPPVIVSIDGSGIYKLTPGKRSDTLWIDVDAGTTRDVKKPNPFVKTGLVGE